MASSTVYKANPGKLTETFEVAAPNSGLADAKLSLGIGVMGLAGNLLREPGWFRTAPAKPSFEFLANAQNLARFSVYHNIRSDIVEMQKLKFEKEVPNLTLGLERFAIFPNFTEEEAKNIAQTILRRTQYYLGKVAAENAKGSDKQLADNKSMLLRDMSILRLGVDSGSMKKISTKELKSSDKLY